MKHIFFIQKIFYDYSTDTFEPVFVKYFKGASDCGTKNAESTPLCPSKSTSTIAKYYKNYNKGTIASEYLDDGQFVLNNGMLVMIENYIIHVNDIQLILISVDLNGINRGPNLWGHDLFTFQFLNNKIVPMGANGSSYSADAYCVKGNSDTLQGIGCTEKALRDPNYFKSLP